MKLSVCVSVVFSSRWAYFDARFLTMIAVVRREDFCGGGQKSVSFVEEELVVVWTLSSRRRRRPLVEFVREILEEGAPR